MKYLQLVAASLRLIRRSHFRSFVLLLTPLLGVAVAIASVNYAAGGRQKVLAEIQRLGTNVVTVSPRLSRSVGGREKTGTIVSTLTPADFSAILNQVDSIRLASPLFSSAFLAKAGDLAKNGITVVGCEPDYFAIRGWELSGGDIFSRADDRRLVRVAVLGSTVARDLFGGQPAVGQAILINRVPFRIVGVLAAQGQTLDIANVDDEVFIPLATAMHRLKNVDYYSGIALEIAGWDRMADAADQVQSVLKHRHSALQNQPDDFQVQTQKQLFETQMAASSRLAALVNWIAASALFVSGLGVLGISWLAVKNRTGEMGTRRALGATAFDLFFQILFEAACVSVVGSAAGAVVGWLAGRALLERAGLPIVFDGGNALLAVGLASFLNLSFALLPAEKAARLDPLVALRHE